jgi:uncharacterized protein
MTITLPGLPPLQWTTTEGEARLEGDTLVLTSAAGADWTNDSTGQGSQHAATSLSFPVTGDFQLSARVRVDAPRTTFDAGVLTLWADSDHWAKVCFERSPQAQDMVVTVVTNDFSDDSNATDVLTDAIWLRVSRIGPAFIFHSSTNGQDWRFVRLFRLLTDAPVVCGFMAQAPMGDTAVARFDEIVYVEETLRELRE